MGPGDKLKAFMKKFIAPKKNRGMSFEEAQAMYENKPNSYIKSRMEKNLATRDKARDLIKEDARPTGTLNTDIVVQKKGELVAYTRKDGTNVITTKRKAKKLEKKEDRQERREDRQQRREERNKKKTRHIPTKI